MKYNDSLHTRLIFLALLLIVPPRLSAVDQLQQPETTEISPAPEEDLPAEPGTGITPDDEAEPETIFPEGEDEEDLFPAYEIEIIGEKPPGGIFFPFVHNGFLYSFSIQAGRAVWRIFIGGDLLNPYTRDERDVYFYDIYNRLYSIDLVEGTLRWKQVLDREIRGEPLVYDEYLIVPTLSGVIYIIERASGEIVYTHSGEGSINAGVIIFDHLGIVPYKNGKITAYDGRTGNTVWSFNAKGIVTVTPVLKDEYIYFGSWDNTFYALDVHSGEVVWTSYIGDALTRDFLVVEDEIILFLAKGEIVCLERSSGEIRYVKNYGNVEFNFNYFSGKDSIFIFTPDFISIDAGTGAILFDYRERSFFLYKEMLFDNMVEGIKPLSEEDRIRLISDTYYTVSNYPRLPPAHINGYVYFVTDNSYLYLYDLEKDFFVLKYRMD